MEIYKSIINICDLLWDKNGRENYVKKMMNVCI